MHRHANVDLFVFGILLPLQIFCLLNLFIQWVIIYKKDYWPQAEVVFNFLKILVEKEKKSNFQVPGISRSVPVKKDSRAVPIKKDFRREAFFWLDRDTK